MKEFIKTIVKFTLGEKRAKLLANQFRAKPAAWIPPPKDGKVRLNLGCGDKILEGHINVDYVSERKGGHVDVQCDLRALSFPENHADEILAVHVIEHFYYWEAKEILEHWNNKLKPGGKIILECPNILEAARQLLKQPKKAAIGKGKDGQLAMWPFYGDPNWKDPLMCHKWGYTPFTLKKLLVQSGYQNVRQEAALFKKREPRDMRIVGEK